MTRTSRFTSLLSIVAAGLIFSSALAVAPGETVDLKSTGSVSPCLTEVVIDAEAPAGAEADAACDELAGAMQAKSFLAELVDTAFDASAAAAVLYEFEVDGDEGTAGNMVDGTLAYAMSWRGVTKVTGAGAYTASIMLTVEDITDAGMPVELARVTVHEMKDATGIDEGSGRDMLSLMLERGHSYRVTGSLATLAATEATAETASAVADYLSDVGSEAAAGGAWVDVLALQVGFDIEDLAAQVEANTEAIEENAEAIEALTELVAIHTEAIAANAEAIEANTMAIDALTEAVGILIDEVAAIKEALEDLGDEVANHTHTYMTGKGVGHNNTLAETGKAIGEDDPEIQPVKTNRGRSKKFSR